ncbi:glutathione S-transferase [Microbulbifer sp. A4B17]|uniref:glutathione S-transferase family protein n=1 Tax=Microbulbifer sp. A4B17 TaxID=359370 RepID=UPI000D52B1A1|nr:glutathione S-transferase family protein [Microbulbifer sp. A4B17]AWF81597.1 glutathione S-transferase [Microbulbifer sp. A4B17]
MYQLFIANKNYSSWSLRPWLLMHHLEIPFNEQLVTFEEGGSWKKFHSFSPTGLVPCLIDGDITVWDSLAIVEYVAEDFPQVWPINRLARSWARSACAEMHSGFSALRNICAMNCGLIVDLVEIPPLLQKDINRIDELWQEGLKRFEGPFLTGEEFTAVDAFFAPVAIRAQNYGLKFSGVAKQYIDHLLSLPSMKKWISDALQEPWRETLHEDEVRNMGVVIEDLRS